MILTDHSAYSLGVDGLDMCEVVEVLDHHALGDMLTLDPGVVTFYPVGSSCSIVYLKYQQCNVSISKDMAGIMLCAILSDTNNLTSSTTIDFDKKAVKELASIADVSDVDALYNELYDQLSNYEGMDDESIYTLDYKEYVMNETNVCISDVKAKTSADAAELKAKMMTAMQTLYPTQNMEAMYCMIDCDEENCTYILHYGKNSDEICKAAFGASQDIKLSPIAVRKSDVAPKLQEAYALAY